MSHWLRWTFIPAQVDETKVLFTIQIMVRKCDYSVEEELLEIIDATLIDYYERDRNACRPSFCKECVSSSGGGGGGSGGGKPYLPRPQPTKYYPEPHSYDQEQPGNDHLDNKPPAPISSDTRPTTYRPIEKPYLPDSRPPNHPPNVDYHINGKWFSISHIITLKFHSLSNALNVSHMMFSSLYKQIVHITRHACRSISIASI